MSSNFISADSLHEEGMYCGERGVEKSACPYRRADRRAHWLRGWQEGQAIRQAAEHAAPLTPEEKQKNHARCQSILAALSGEARA